MSITENGDPARLEPVLNPDRLMAAFGQGVAA